MKALPRFAPIIAILALLLLAAIGGSALANNNAVPEVDAETATVQMYSPTPSGTETTQRSETNSPIHTTGDPVSATKDGMANPTGTPPGIPAQLPAPAPAPPAPAPVQAPNPAPVPQVPLDYQYWDDDWDNDDDADDGWDDDGDDDDWDDD